jgi:hypothetical protein
MKITSILQNPAFRCDFRAQSTSAFNSLRKNSLRNGTGNFLEVSGKIFGVTGNAQAKNPTPDQYFDHTGRKPGRSDQASVGVPIFPFEVGPVRSKWQLSS